VEPDTVQASDVMDDCQRLAHDGYRVTADIPDAADTDSNKQITLLIQLWVRGQVVKQTRISAVDDTPENRTALTRQLPVITAMLEFMNTGGEPRYLRNLAVLLDTHVPALTPKGFELVAVDATLDRTHYYKDDNGKYFAAVRGVLSCKMDDDAVLELIHELQQPYQDDAP